eukprot:CAMPEP_0178421420 /NCGR_PEP_ID=MMETSP0689_2-20121128/26637_1 /TAXON_ID=160604 /ORGANISM="Amphidinium massartii, Strain CS-259" /LENGTH=361 /DNA_ID=CAMNT_0020042929 /DNA_START=29 /DNA_END=1111 /DNA_ORIENTATION=-
MSWNPFQLAFCNCACDDNKRGRQRDLPNEVRVHQHPHDAGFQELVTKPRGFPVYSTTPDQPLLGVPIKEGLLWHLSTQEQFHAIEFNLYINGFSFRSASGAEASVTFSPFTLVRNCRFQTGAYAGLKSFKVSALDPEPVCYFAVRSTGERVSEEERSEWVLAISHAILLVTASLLPQCGLTPDPLLAVENSARRLLAGYVIHKDGFGTVSVLYGDLQAHGEDVACLYLYENEDCRHIVSTVHISDSSMCNDIVGINCCCFIVDSHYFAAHSPSERKLWLRALSNLKVKVQNHAPPPTEEELSYYREGIRQHCSPTAAFSVESQLSGPLLTLLARREAMGWYTRETSFTWSEGASPSRDGKQ